MGHIVGYTGNAAIGVANQVFIAIFIFVGSTFTGMSVLVSRFAGAGDTDKVNRTVYQACITAVGLAVFVMAPAGFLLAPALLDFVNAAPAVQAQALPFLRIMVASPRGDGLGGCWKIVSLVCVGVRTRGVPPGLRVTRAPTAPANSSA